jgi:hypothetical protein
MNFRVNIGNVESTTSSYKPSFSTKNSTNLPSSFLTIECNDCLSISSKSTSTDLVLSLFLTTPKQNKDNIVLASSLDLLPENPAKDGFNQAALIHTLTYYGYCPPKKETIECNDCLSISSKSTSTDLVLSLFLTTPKQKSIPAELA